MPRMRMIDRSVIGLKPTPGRQVDYFDDRFPGFGLRVSASGRKSWFLMYRFRGRPRRLTFEPYPHLTVADARAKAAAAMRDVVQGVDPAAVKAAERRAETFAELAAEYLERHAKPRKRTWREDERILERQILPTWRHLRAKEITRRDVRLLIDRMLARDARTYANRIFALARVFNFGLQRDIVMMNPCHGLPMPAPESRRDRVLSEDEIRVLWAAFEAEGALVGASFKLRLLTAQRGGEILGMRWDHIDFGAGWWTIPGEVAKNGMAHRVPLSRQVRAVLAEIRLQNRPGPWIFPNPMKNGSMVTTQKAAERIVKSTGIEFRQHDLRRTAASLMTGMGISRLVVGKILNHVETGVTAVYDRHSYDEEKRQALEAWGGRVEELVKQRTQPATPSAAFEVSA
jgi:integrase